MLDYVIPPYLMLLFFFLQNLTSRPSIVLAPSNGLLIFTDFLNFLSSEEWINNFLEFGTEHGLQR